jgi:uncharacterized protein with von Willebrand factor type A (vWA) domain
MAKLSDMLLRTLIEAECPSCEYVFEIQMLDARVQAFRRCPCCRQLIRLVDSGGSMYGELEDVDRAMESFERTLKDLF